MSVNIPQFFFDASSEVSTLSNAFLQKHKLNYFQYCSVYKDGSHAFLVNRPDFVEARYQANLGVRSSVASDQRDEQNYVFLWNGNLPDQDTNMARDFDLDNGLCFVQRQPDKYNLIAFAAPKKERGILDFYLNHASKLRAFIDEFTESAKDLIAKADAKRFHLPQDLRDVNEDLLFWNQTRSVLRNGSAIELSLREFECLRLTAEGYTMMETARRLDLSHRTIETYLNRCKAKLGVERKPELIRLYRNSYE